MPWLLIYEIAYVLVVIAVCIKIIYDTQNSAKALAYMLLVIFVPVAGILLYFLVGTNYRVRKIYSKKIISNDRLSRLISEMILEGSRENIERGSEAVAQYRRLAWYLTKDGLSPLTRYNSVKLLVNGENKFPEVVKAIAGARHHIHIEYYIIEDDPVSRAIEAALAAKLREGIKVRIIYDDFGSWAARKTLIRRLAAAGAEVHPFYRLRAGTIASRLNYRNHRKIIVIDGKTGFTGGINISQRYDNQAEGNRETYWRDTHLRVDGPGVFYLQYLFLADWNFCSGVPVAPDGRMFPMHEDAAGGEDKFVQIAASGPDSDNPAILYSLLGAIHQAQEEVLITTPYLIPDESLLDALIMTSLGGVTVKLLVPGKGDSALVNAAAASFFRELLDAGVEIYRYRRGFVHAKTLVADGKVAMIGTANLDYRSFDLNFEVNAIVYDTGLAGELRRQFYEDLEWSDPVDAAEWNRRPMHRRFAERVARLLSPLL